MGQVLAASVVRYRGREAAGHTSQSDVDTLALTRYCASEVISVGMARISVYVDEDLHRALKAAASLMGVSLSEYMVEAAQRMLHTPHRKVASSKMDAIRALVAPKIPPGEIQAMREEGRRY